MPDRPRGEAQVSSCRGSPGATCSNRRASAEARPSSTAAGGSRCRVAARWGLIDSPSRTVDNRTLIGSPHTQSLNRDVTLSTPSMAAACRTALAHSCNGDANSTPCSPSNSVAAAMPAPCSMKNACPIRSVSGSMKRSRMRRSDSTSCRIGASGGSPRTDRLTTRGSLAEQISRSSDDETR